MKKTAILLTAIILFSLFAFTASAYGMGGAMVYNGSTKVGSGSVWNNENGYPAQYNNREVYAETTALATSNSVSARIAYVYFDIYGWMASTSSYELKQKANTKIVMVTKVIHNNHEPIDVLADFAVNTYTATYLKPYNFG